MATSSPLVDLLVVHGLSREAANHVARTLDHHSAPCVDSRTLGVALCNGILHRGAAIDVAAEEFKRRCRVDFEQPPFDGGQIDPDVQMLLPLPNPRKRWK